MGLKKLSEDILKFIIQNVSSNNTVNTDKIYSNFSNKDEDIVFACLDQLHEYDYIRFIHGDLEKSGLVLLYPKGRLYFEV